MKKASPKENRQRLIGRSGAAYVPYQLESVIGFAHKNVSLYDRNGIIGGKEWTDAWGVGFTNINEATGAYPVSHPLKSLEDIDSLPSRVRRPQGCGSSWNQPKRISP